MGPTVSKISATSYNSSVQTSYNVTQYNSSIVCDSKCQNTQSDFYIVIENSKVGSITFDQQCSADATCAQQNDIQIINTLQATNKQSSEAKAESNTPVVPYVGTFKSVDLTSEARNYSIMSSYNAAYININMGCVSTSINTQENVFITVKDSTTGDINFTQKGNATLSCQSINSAKFTNNVTLENDQTAVAESKDIVTLFGSFGIIILIIIIAVIASALKKKKGGEKKD